MIRSRVDVAVLGVVIYGSVVIIILIGEAGLAVISGSHGRLKGFDHPPQLHFIPIGVDVNRRGSYSPTDGCEASSIEISR